MKKNLKKVISAVLALTLAMSSFVAMTTSAATFADVADTANYAEAVNALAALGAISGYEDGTFLPDNNITRAEVTTMVVAAMNMSADAQSSGATTKFADVNEKAKWAAGYVNVGVANGWISGMSATEFAPSDNVTYAQVLSMLTRILGYGDYAVSKGGWPDGYLAAAASAGILSGVSAAANDALTRAQVAQLIWNAVQAPMLEVTVFGVDAMNSSMEKLDGKGGRAYKTVLSDKFNAYIFNNAVVAGTAQYSGLEVGTVDIDLNSANDWNPEEERYANTAKDSNGNLVSDTLTKVAVGDTDAEDYLFSSAKIIAKYVDDEWSLVYLKPTGKISTTAVDGSLVNAQVYDPNNNNAAADDNGIYAVYKNGQLDYYELNIKKSKISNSVTTYKLTNDVTLVVNGKEYANAFNNVDTVRDVIENAVGDVVLYEDIYASGKMYDVVAVDIYGLAKVSQVQVKNSETVVRFSSTTIANINNWNMGTELTVSDDDIDSGDKVVTVTKNGEAADLAALAKGDIVAIKYNVNDGDVDDSTRVDVIATTDKVTGVYTYEDTDEGLYEIGGAMYKAARNLGLQLGTTYTIALDPFGRLFASEDEVTAKNYAILEKYDANRSSVDYEFIDVVTLDGQSKRLFIDDKTDIETTVETIANLTPANQVTNYYAFAGSAIAPKDRVIEYSVKPSTGRITSVNHMDPNAQNPVVVPFTTAEYNAAFNKLSGSLSTTAVVLDASAYCKTGNTSPKANQMVASSLSELSEGVQYDGFLVHKSRSDNLWSYVVITSKGAVYGASSDFAVAAVDATAAEALKDGETIYTLRVMKDGADDASALEISATAEVYVGGVKKGTTYNSAAALAEIKEGAAFFYTTDADGLVDRIDVVFKGGYLFTALRDVVNAEQTLVTLPSGQGIVNANAWFANDNENQVPGPNANEAIQLFIAPVILATDRAVTFGTMASESANNVTYWYVNTADTNAFSVADDANIYACDMSSGAPTNYTKFSSGAFNGIDTTEVGDSGKAYFGKTGSYDFTGAVQVALVMAVDGVITNAVIFAD